MDDETTAETTVLIPQAHGGALKVGGTKGNKGGRPPTEHVEWCRSAIGNPKTEKEVLKILHNAEHPQFASMWGKVADRAYGRVKENGGGSRRVMRFIFVKENKLTGVEILDEPGG